MKQHHTKRVCLADLRPADYNPRRIDDRAFTGLSASLKRFGYVERIVWNTRTGNVVGGHQRLRAMLAAGVVEADVVVVDLSETEEKALNVALNSPTIAGEFTPELDAILEELRGSAVDLYDELLFDDLAQPAVLAEGDLEGCFVDRISESADCEQITFLFPPEDAAVVRRACSDHSKTTVAERITALCAEMA